jgi:uncharacterized protein
VPCAPIYDGFLPGRHAVDGIGQGGFRFGGMSHQGALLMLPSGVHIWSPPEPFKHSPALYAQVLVEASEVDILLIGAGTIPWPLPFDVRAALREAGISADVMTTSSAASTFNVLLGEGRRVAAALVAVT